MYKRVELEEGAKVQFLAMYVLNWPWGDTAPEVGFVEADPQDAWVPSTERLPTEDGKYLVTYEISGPLGVERRQFTGLAIYDSEKESWTVVSWTADSMYFGHLCILAWQDLPAPYRVPEEE